MLANSFIKDDNPNLSTAHPQGVNYQHSMKYDLKGRPLW